MSDLPPGFQLDGPQGLVIDMTRGPRPGAGAAPSSDLPPGFQLDAAPDGVRMGARIGGQFAQNTNDAIANSIGAPVDLVAAGLRKIGVPVNAPMGGSESLKGGIDYVATLPGRLRDAIGGLSAAPLTETRTSRFEPENRNEKIAAGVGQGVGSVLGTMMPAAAIANTARAGTMTQSLAQTMASQPVTQLASGAVGGGVTGATDNPYLGAAAGIAVPFGVATARGVISPITNRLSPHEAQTAAFAAKEGVPLTPAQATGSPVLRGLEETMAKLPFGSGPMKTAYEGQRQAFNKSTLSRAGVDATDASPETLNRAFRSAGQTFDDLASRTTVNVDNQFINDVRDTAQNYGRRLNTDVAPVFKSYLDDLEPLVQAATQGQNPQLLGAAYKNIRSSMTDRMRSTQDGDLKRALGGIVNALDGAMERSAAGSLAGEWKEARRQYQALMTVDKAMQGGTQVDRAAGNIPYSSLKGAVAQGDRAGFARGRGQMNESAQLADFLSTRVPDSGTVSRGMWANLLTGGALMGGGGVAAAGGFSPAALGAAAATAAGPAIASRLYNTGLVQKYLTNQTAGSTDLKALFAAQAAQQALQSNEEPRQLARAMMRANERMNARESR